MATTPQPNSPFSRALRQWISDLKRDGENKGPFYEKVLAAQEEVLAGSGAEACAKCADSLNAYVQELEGTMRKESRFLRLCSKLEPLVDGISGLMAICGTLAQAAPFEVGIAFAGAKLLLQLASKQVAAFDKIVDILAEIGRNLRCYDKISAAYETSSEVQELLIDAYQTIISFWHRASQVLARSSLRIAIANLVKPIDAEWKTCLDKLQKNAQGVMALAQATSALESTQDRKLDLTRKVAKWIIGLEDGSKLLFRDDLAESRAIRHEGTCNWIFEHPAFQSWCNTKDNAVIWYNAPPGSGKTVLSAAVAQHLEENGKLVYYRYSFDDGTRKTPMAALRSIALQLRTIMGRIPEQILQCYNKEVERHAYKLSAQDTETALQVVEAFLEQVPPVYIIIDGIDECSDVKKALEMFRRLARTYTCGIARWFFSSRDEPLIRAIMEGLGAVEINPPPDAIMKDISTFLESQGKELALNKCASCVRFWTAASQDNFLYSKLMFDILCGIGVTCEDEIHEELLRFPVGLASCYLRCLDSIIQRARNELYVKLARRMFCLLAYAAKSLTVNEMRNALAIQMEAEYRDHQPGRVPSRDLIKELGGSLIRFESSPDGDYGNFRVRFVHKSVLDFFKEDPDKLGLPKDRRDLRSFFFNEQDGNLELGRYCLKYLQFQRYQAKVDVPALLDNNDEHAFLRYAAAFWFQHLNDVSHSQQLFAEVRAFVQSAAFGTCVEVQIKVRPHLFARYTEIRGLAFALGLEGGELNDDDSLMIPLPDWVELYEPEGRDISMTLFNFVREWHEVLVSHPVADGLCQMDQTDRAIFPGLASMMSKSIRTTTIKGPKAASEMALVDVSVRKSKVYARIAYLEEGVRRWQEGPISASEPTKRGAIPTLRPEQGANRQLLRFGNGSRDSSAGHSIAWSIALNNLDVKLDRDEACAFQAPRSCSLATKPSSRSMIWSLVTESTVATDHTSVMALHLRNPRFEAARRQETDSGYDSASNPDTDANPYSGSDSDSESSWSGSDSSSGEGEDEQQTLVSDCLVICCEGEKPIWIPWAENSKGRSQVSCAVHPQHKTAVYSRSIDELRIVNLATGETSRRTMEEPPAARASAAVNCREMRFSSCGHYLFYLLVMISDSGELGSTCQAFLSVFRFDEEFTDGDIMRPCAEVLRLGYKFGLSSERLRAPYILSCWNADTLYLCLPPLSCNPKVVRLSQLTTGGVIDTLKKPIFFPNSTPRRNPKILYRPSHTEREIFILALDGVVQENEGTSTSSFPMVVEWKVDRFKGWRAWYEAVDGEEPRLAEENKTYAQLRGTFIDADRRFNVIVRNGLNWTKKAFLSCA